MEWQSEFPFNVRGEMSRRPARSLWEGQLSDFLAGALGQLRGDLARVPRDARLRLAGALRAEHQLAKVGVHRQQRPDASLPCAQQWGERARSQLIPRARSPLSPHSLSKLARQVRSSASTSQRPVRASAAQAERLM